MTGITDLQTVFGSATKVPDQDGETVSVAGSAGASQSVTADAGNQLLVSGDQSVVSSTGGAMLQAMGTSDVRTDKVASLQAAIANGNYNVSSADVADKLIGSMLDKG